MHPKDETQTETRQNTDNRPDKGETETQTEITHSQKRQAFRQNLDTGCQTKHMYVTSSKIPQTPKGKHQKERQPQRMKVNFEKTGK
jgi:hypothetical protein